MIDYNLVLYIGIGLIVFGFVLFLVSEHFERQADIKLFRQEQLTKSFDRAKIKKINYKKVKAHFWKKIEQDGLNLSRKKYK